MNATNKIYSCIDNTNKFSFSFVMFGYLWFSLGRALIISHSLIKKNLVIVLYVVDKTIVFFPNPDYLYITSNNFSSLQFWCGTHWSCRFCLYDSFCNHRKIFCHLVSLKKVTFEDTSNGSFCGVFIFVQHSKISGIWNHYNKYDLCWRRYQYHTK